jgi:hypothetical protein
MPGDEVAGLAGGLRRCHASAGCDGKQQGERRGYAGQAPSASRGGRPLPGFSGWREGRGPRHGAGLRVVGHVCS